MIAACSADPLRFLGTTRPTSILIAVGARDRVTTVIDHRPGVPVSLEVDAEVHQQLWALEYEQTVDELVLPARALTEDPKGLPLPPPDGVHGLSFDGEWPDEWTTVSPLPEALQEIRYRETSPCPAVTFEQRRFESESTDQPAFAVPLDDQRALVGGRAGRLFEVSRDSDRALTELSTSTPSQAAFAAKDGEIWLLGADGRVVRGRPETGFVAAPSLPPVAGGWLEITGSLDDAPLELYALGDGQEVARYSEGRWTMLDSPGVVDPSRTGQDIAWIEAGLAVSIGYSSSAIVEHRADGTYRLINVQLPPQFNEDAPFKLQHVRGVGVFFGSRYNVLFQRKDGRWTDLPSLPATPKADVMADLGGGHLVSGGNGILAYWVDQFGHCDPLMFPTGDELREAVALPRQLLVFALDREGGSLVNTFTMGRP